MKQSDSKPKMGKPKLLLVGAASNISPLLSTYLTKRYEIVGLDIRPLRNEKMFPGEFHKVSYSKREINDIFSQHQFTTMIHLGRVTSTQQTSNNRRFLENVSGLQNLLNNSLENGIKNFIIVSTHLVYGALKTNHLYIKENHPLKAAAKFIKLSSSVAFDHTATEFLWQHRQVKTTVLRPVFIAGPTVRNGLMAALKSKFCPKVMGYDPLIQVIHENDLVNAILLALKKKKRGVYNVAGEGVVPFSDAIIQASATPVPVPYPFFSLGESVIERMPWRASAHLADYFRYPVVVSDEAFRQDFDFEPEYSTLDTLKSINQ